MEIKQILKSLEEAGVLEELLTFTPLVGPNAVISSNIDWSSRFREGRTLFYSGDFERAAELFHELDENLPGRGRFLSSAKINETFCWLRLDRFTDYVQLCEPLAEQNKIYGASLWNLAIAYCRSEKMEKAEECLKKWLESSSLQFLGKGYLLLSILQFHNGQIDDAITSFHTALKVDKLFCKRVLEKHLGSETTEAILEVEITLGEPTKKELQIVAKDEVFSALLELLVPRAPSKYPLMAQQLNEFDYQFGYVTALEKFGDGDVDRALMIIESLISGDNENDALLWAKAACLMAKREWDDAMVAIEDQLEDLSIPGGVFWNATCAYFNLGKYEEALDTIIKCTDAEYRSSPIAWLVQGLLAHLCGRIYFRDAALKEAIRISPKQMAFYISIIKQIGADLGEPPTEETIQIVKIDDEILAKKYGEIIKSAKELYKKERELEAAKEFVQLSPESLRDIPEIIDTSFRPVILPTCPAKLYDCKDIYLFGIAAFQRKAYEEAAQIFEDLYTKTDGSYPVVVNLAASLILTERYSRAIDILKETIESREHGGAYAIRNLISALMRSGKYEDAFPWVGKLLDASSTEYFNFVKMAYIAQLTERKEDVATGLFNACTMNLAEPSIRLKGAAIKACLEVNDLDRAIALVKYFLKEAPLPYVVAGVIRPIMPAEDCKGYSQMYRQYQLFSKGNDARAALAYFQEVYSSREDDYGASINAETVDGLFNACMFYGRSLFWNQKFENAHEILRQAFGLLSDHSNYYSRDELSKRYFALTDVYFNRGHYFWAQELCNRGLEADSRNLGLRRIRNKIKNRIEKIPERSREAMKDLAELPIIPAEKAKDFIGLLPTVSQLIQTLPQDFPASIKVISDLNDLTNDVINLESVPIVDRKGEIIRLREIITKIEQELPLYLPKTFISAILPVLRGAKKILTDIQAKSICPEFTFAVEPISYYRESEASLVYKLRNIGPADILELRIKIKSAPQEEYWAPVIEEKSFGIVKKDELLWIDWPVHLDVLPEPDLVIKTEISLRFTGGSLEGKIVEQVIGDQYTNLTPFIDISVDYPVVALRPGGGNKLYGRENLIRTLKNSFSRSGQTRIPFLEGVRKVGKTSILYFLANRLTDSFLPIYVNLDTTWTNAYQLLAQRISDELTTKKGLEFEALSQITIKDDFDRFLVKALREAGITHIVLLLDEFHTVIDRIEKGRLSNEFLGDLRYMYMDPQQKISVAFADWYLIDELKSRIPAQLWTDFAREPISFLNELDSREAILFPAQDSQVRFERDVISRIYYWTNGYPWHIQWICSELINHLNTQKRYVAIPQDIDLIVHKLMREDRFFNEGVCRPERLHKNSQDLIYELLEIIKGSKEICTWFDREVVNNLRLPFDVKHEVARLTQLEVFQERDNLL